MKLTPIEINRLFSVLYSLENYLRSIGVHPRVRMDARRLRTKLESNQGEISSDMSVLLKRVNSTSEKYGFREGTEIFNQMISYCSQEYGKKTLNSLEKELKNRFNEAKKHDKKLKVVFLIGSGASAPPPSAIPTVNGLLSYLIENLPPTEIPFVNKVKEWANIDNVNIEDILTAGYLSTMLVQKPLVNKLVGEIIYREEDDRVGELREREYVFSFQDLVNRIFSMVSGMMAKADSNAVHESIAKLISELKDENDFDFSIATTNYDVCVEKALQKFNTEYTYKGIEDGCNIPLVKIHGSVNWFYCEGCQSVITYSMKELEAFNKIYPATGSCQKCGTSTSLFMVPPIAYKYVMFPPLIDIWQVAMDTIESADVIVVVGYSFALTDDHIFKMVVSGIKKNASKLVYLDISDNSFSSLRQRLSAYHLKLEYAILGDSTTTVPEVVQLIEKLNEKNIKKKKNSAKEEQKKSTVKETS